MVHNNGGIGMVINHLHSGRTNHVAVSVYLQGVATARESLTAELQNLAPKSLRAHQTSRLEFETIQYGRVYHNMAQLWNGTNPVEWHKPY